MSNLFWTDGSYEPPIGSDRGYSKHVVIQRADGEFDSGFYDFCMKLWWCDELEDFVDEIIQWCDPTDYKDGY